MSKLIQALLLAIVGLVVLTSAGPTIGRLIAALGPVVLEVCIGVAILQLVCDFTRQ
jgi:hypothetical protein